MGYIEETEDLKLDFNKIASITGQAVLPLQYRMLIQMKLF